MELSFWSFGFQHFQIFSCPPVSLFLVALSGGKEGFFFFKKKTRENDDPKVVFLLVFSGGGITNERKQQRGGLDERDYSDFKSRAWFLCDE
jgi:hypothetical protein